MSALWAGARLVAGALPWQAWAIVVLILGAGIYGCQEYRRGEAAASLNQERKQGLREQVGQVMDLLRDVQNDVGCVNERLDRVIESQPSRRAARAKAS